MMKWIALSVCVLAAAPGSAVASDAGTQTFNYFYYKMLNTSDDPLPIWLNDVTSMPVPVNDSEAATKAAIQTWNDVTCSWGRFRYAGRVSQNDAGIVDPEDDEDAFSVSTTFISDAGDPRFHDALLDGTVVSSSVALAYDGELYQCDIYLNDVRNLGSPAGGLWSTGTPTPDTQLDVQTFVTHELGHCMGLADSTDVDHPEYVMYGNIATGRQNRSLTSHDVQQACAWMPVTGKVGSPCSSASDCGSGKACVSVTRPDGTTGKMCTVGCSPADGGDDPCDLPFTCQPSTAVVGHSDACLPTASAPVTQVGAPCADPSQPDACGAAYSICEGEDAGTLPDGRYARWPDGYCTQDCKNNGCPSGSTCVPQYPTQDSSVCLKSCGSLTDCRPGYTCVNTGLATPVCVVACHQDVDCNPPQTNAFYCRISDGACLSMQGAGQIGDPCSQTADCGGGLVCYGQGSSKGGVCAQGCGTSWTACPTTTTCHALPASGGSSAGLYCTRDCQKGTCSTGDMCAPIENGQGCLPGCRSNSECPSGQVCSQGECVTAQVPDAGCGDCAVDAGTEQDAGTSEPPTSSSSSGGAFGCESTGPSGPGGAGLALFGLMLLAFASGGRKWRAR